VTPRCWAKVQKAPINNERAHKELKKEKKKGMARSSTRGKVIKSNQYGPRELHARGGQKEGVSLSKRTFRASKSTF